MLMLDADPPDWWLDANPDERAEVVDDGGTITYPGVSYASEKWRNDVGEFFRALLNHVVSQPYASHVFGVKLGAGSTYEWQQNGMSLSSNGDYSEAALNAFRKWLSEKYGTDTALRKAWGNGSVTLQTAQIPTRAERKAAGYRTLLDGVKQRNVIDYQLFYSDMTTDSILCFASAIKEACGGRWVVGTYNGYLINGLTYESNNIANSSFSRLLSSDLVDFFCAPILYASRMSGMSAGYMTMVDSVLDAGKMFFSEVDERTVFYDDNGWQAPYLLQEWGQTYTLRDTIEMLKRDFANVLAKGAGLWWYDMWGGWFDDPEIYSLISAMSEEMEYDLSRPAESVSPVAWIQADDLLAYMPYDFDGTYDVLLQTHSNQKESLAKVGVPYDMYYLSDLEGGLDKKYDIYIIEAFGIDKDTRLDIELYLQRDGVTIIWVGLPGIYGEDGAVDPASVSELVGMDIASDVLRRLLRDDRKRQPLCHGRHAGIRVRKSGVRRQGESDRVRNRSRCRGARYARRERVDGAGGERNPPRRGRKLDFRLFGGGQYPRGVYPQFIETCGGEHLYRRGRRCFRQRELSRHRQPLRRSALHFAGGQV